MNTLFDNETTHQYIATGYAIDNFSQFKILEMLMTMTNLEQWASAAQNFVIDAASQR